MDSRKLLIGSVAGVSALTGGLAFTACFQEMVSRMVSVAGLGHCVLVFLAWTLAALVALGGMAAIGLELRRMSGAIVQAIKISIWVNIAISILVASLALYAGFQHNPQGEFFDPVTGKIEYSYSALLFMAWFLTVGLSGAVVIALGLGFTKIIQRIRNAPGK